MIIAVDFDGTCVTHKYPELGEEIGAAPVLRRLAALGHKLILYTMRSGEALLPAMDWFSAHGIALHGCNSNPEQQSWTESPKVFAHMYIDDAALGCPLIYPATGRPYVDWDEVARLLQNLGVLEPEIAA